MKTLLFLNGEPPVQLPNAADYDVIACTDGAFHYLKCKGFPLQKLDFISGDFDSHSGNDESLYESKFIHTPDQEKTDFAKALDLLLEKKSTEVHVYGGSGGEMDHFLGNVTVAYHYKELIKISFYDEFSTYFFIPKVFEAPNVQNKMISLYPFPLAENISTEGLNWPLVNESLTLVSRIGTRNFAVEDTVKIRYESGDILFFIGQNYL